MKAGAAFSEAIRNRRKELGLRQADVARELGISVPYLSDLERGNRHVPPEALVRRFALALDLSPEYLLFYGELAPGTMLKPDLDVEKVVRAYRMIAEKKRCLTAEQQKESEL